MVQHAACSMQLCASFLHVLHPHPPFLLVLGLSSHFAQPLLLWYIIQHLSRSARHHLMTRLGRAARLVNIRIESEVNTKFPVLVRNIGLEGWVVDNVLPKSMHVPFSLGTTTVILCTRSWTDPIQYSMRYAVRLIYWCALSPRPSSLPAKEIFFLNFGTNEEEISHERLVVGSCHLARRHPRDIGNGSFTELGVEKL